MNIPTYTKSSRIYSNLVEIRRGIESEELEQPQPLQLPKGKTTAGASTATAAPGGGAQGKRAPAKQHGAQNQAQVAIYNEKDYQKAARVSC